MPHALFLRRCLPLTSLYIKQGRYKDALALAGSCLSTKEIPDGTVLLGLQANAGMSALRLDPPDKESGNMYLDKVYGESAADRPEVFLGIADAFYESGEVKSALKFYQKLVGIKNYDEMALYVKMAECQERSESLDDAKQTYRTILSRIRPNTVEHLEVSILLAELLDKCSDTEEVLQVRQPTQHDYTTGSPPSPSCFSRRDVS